MTSPHCHSSRENYNRPPPPATHRDDRESQSWRRDRRRPRRILAFAILFASTALRRVLRERSSLLTIVANVDSDNDGNDYFASTAVASRRRFYDEERFASAEGADLVVFYNLYVPRNESVGGGIAVVPKNEDEGDAANAVRVVRDQMEQIAEALSREEKEEEEILEKEKRNTKEKEEKRGVVFYNSIGDDSALPPEMMADLCRDLHPRLECRRVGHYEEAGEAVTLQDLHDYCSHHVATTTTNGNSMRRVVNETHDAAAETGRRRRRVAYLHSKGSYHPTPENHAWRRIATDAALHPSCLHPPDPSCDVCGAQFYIRYAIMFPGNMWTATCDHVARLLPPLRNDEYESKKEGSVARFLMLEMWGVLHDTLDERNAEHFGLGRYAWEHWVTSTPHGRHCEVHSTEVGPRMLLGRDPEGRTFGPEHYDWGMAPRRITTNLGGLRPARLRLQSDPERQFREYYYLPGNLLKWFHLYGPEGIPAEDSWVWRHFLAGERWKGLVKLRGENAVEEMVKDSNPRFHSAFFSPACGKMTAELPMQPFRGEDSLLSLPDPPIVVFYQISFPPMAKEKAMTAIKSQFDALSMGQYNHKTGTFDQSRNVLLYYTVAGGTTQETDFLSNLCEDKSDRVVCRRQGKYDAEGVYGESFRQLHSFCDANPTRDVIHIANRLPGHACKDTDKTFDALELGAITSAVTSTMCHPSEGSCNVCGTEFYPLPFFHFAGNMFSASCAYVNKLLPPSTFEKTMNDVAGGALVARLKETYTTKLLDFNARILGSYQHSTEHWIGSHPDLKPCDVAPMEPRGVDGTALLDRMKRHSRGAAPRRDITPDGFSINPAESLIRRKRSLALREYYYLAGNVFRWGRLYDQMPDAKSWVWQWFPDGQLWEVAARISGERAVEDLAEHRAPH